uniref:Capsid protein n=1 Tax=viral metagenome TaxID=1070528 RepID=A0A6M3IGK0_9ZZZZ
MSTPKTNFKDINFMLPIGHQKNNMLFDPLTYIRDMIDLSKSRPGAFRKAKQDYVSGAMFHPQDLANIIYLYGIPEHPFMYRLMVDPNIYDSPFYWSEMTFTAATGTGAYFTDGDAPSIASSVPSRKNNTIFRAGLCAQVTDQEAAMYTKAGGWRTYGPGNALQWFQGEIELQMKARTIELLDEMSYIFMRGVKGTTISGSGGRADVQCDGMLTMISNNAVDGTGSYITEDLLKSLAKKIRTQKTGRNPSMLYCNVEQKMEMDTWATNIWFGRNRDLEAGKEVSTFHTGIFILNIEIDDHMPTGSCAMIDHSVWYKMDLIPMMMTPLAKVDTSVKRMVTYYGSLKCGSDRSSGKITGMTA